MIPGATDEGPKRSRTGISQLPWRSHRRIGLLVLAVLVLPWLPIFGPSRDATLARRVHGVGEVPILGFAFAPDDATIATTQVDGRVPLRDAAWGVSAHSFLNHRRPALALAYSPQRGVKMSAGAAPHFNYTWDTLQ